jgi:hypothetical protein
MAHYPPLPQKRISPEIRKGQTALALLGKLGTLPGFLRLSVDCFKNMVSVPSFPVFPSFSKCYQKLSSGGE